MIALTHAVPGSAPDQPNWLESVFFVARDGKYKGGFYQRVRRLGTNDWGSHELLPPGSCRVDPPEVSETHRDGMPYGLFTLFVLLADGEKVYRLSWNGKTFERSVL